MDKPSECGSCIYLMLWIWLGVLSWSFSVWHEGIDCYPTQEKNDEFLGRLHDHSLKENKKQEEEEEEKFFLCFWKNNVNWRKKNIMGLNWMLKILGI